jgi:SSS family solute:Na+ symporter
VVLAALIVPAFIVSPGLLQKAYASENERALRLGVGAQGLVLLVFALAPPLLGMIARVYAPALGQPELAVPTVLTLGLPTALGALGLAAVFSAEVSTADTVLFMLSTSLSKDMYKRFLAPEASDERVLRVARGAAVAGGALGVVLAIVIPSVIASLTAFYAVLGVSLFVPVVAGLHTRRPGVPEALAAVGAGVAALLAARFAALAELSPLLDPTLVGIVTSGLAFGAVFVARVRWRPDSIRA